MSRVLEDTHVTAIALLLSRERLSALTALTGSERIAIELHQETLSLGGSLMAVIASVELALRNTICENLTAYFGTSGWLTHPPAPFRWRDFENTNANKALESARRAIYSKLSQSEKAALDAQAFPNGRPPSTSHQKRARERRKQIAPSHGKVVAETTIFFWKRLYSPDYEQALWRTTLKRTFPSKKIRRADVATALEHIYQARNRLAHHEPVLHKRFEDTMTAIEFITHNLGVPVPSENTPLAKLIADDLDDVKRKAKQLHRRLASFRGS